MVWALSFDGTPFSAAMPNNVWWEPPQSALDELAGGGFTATPQDLGGILHLEWGPDAAVAAVIPALITARNSLDEHTVSWTNPAGTSRTKNVIWPSDPPERIIPGFQFGRFDIELSERPV